MAIIIGEGGSADRASISLATRRNSWINNVTRQEVPVEVHRASAELFTRDHPNAALRSASARYNCMALPFASRRTWVAPVTLDPMLSLILADDDYRQIEISELEPGDLVVYRATLVDRSVSHVAIAVRKEPNLATGSFEVFVLRKWGQFGEYVHAVNDVPALLGTPAEYWTDRSVFR